MGPEAWWLCVAGLLSGGGLGGVAGWLAGRRHVLKKSQAEVSSLSEQRNDLAARVESLGRLHGQTQSIREGVVRGGLVSLFHQPVVLTGISGVGKTSLLSWWDTPWDRPAAVPTTEMRTATVTAYYAHNWQTGAHPDDATLVARYHAHLLLRVFDFPGERSQQQAIEQKLVDETHILHECVAQMRRLNDDFAARADRLGVVIACLFDCEAVSDTAQGGRLMEDHRDYYTADLFSKLRDRVTDGTVRIDRILLIFNKFDAARRAFKGRTDDECLRACMQRFKDERVTSYLRGLVHKESLHAIRTILATEKELEADVMGAQRVKGLASQTLAQIITGKHLAETASSREAEGAGVIPLAYVA